MTIVFDHAAGEVYIDSPERPYPKQEVRRDYYFQPEGEGDEQKRLARLTVNRMHLMYELGKMHRSLEIRKILGV